MLAGSRHPMHAENVLPEHVDRVLCKSPKLAEPRATCAELAAN